MGGLRAPGLRTVGRLAFSGGALEAGGEKGFSRFLAVGMVAAPQCGRDQAAAMAEPWADKYPEV